MKAVAYHIFRFAYLTREWFARRFTTAGRMAFVGLVISAVIGVDTKGTLVYQVFGLLSVTVLVSMLWSKNTGGKVVIKRIMPRFGTCGTALSYRILVHNPTAKIQAGLTLFEDFESPCPDLEEFVSTPEPGEEKRNGFDRTFGYYRWLWLIAQKRMAEAEAIHLPALQPGSDTEIITQLLPLRRGILRMCGFTVARPDPLGLFNACRKIDAAQSVPVLPKRYRLPPVSLPGSRQYQSGGVALASSVGDSEEFMSLRDYRQGDPIRKIHWKSWAKTGRPVIKEHQDEYFVRHALIMDTYTKSKYSGALEAAVSIAASFACEVRTQESLLDLMFVGAEAYCFTSGRSLAHTDRMLEILSGVQACRAKSFDCLTSLVVSRASMLSGCICIFIDWDDERRALVNHLKSRGISGRVLVVTDESRPSPRSELQPGRQPATDVQWLRPGEIQKGLLQI